MTAGVAATGGRYDSGVAMVTNPGVAMVTNPGVAMVSRSRPSRSLVGTCCTGAGVGMGVGGRAEWNRRRECLV